MSTRRDYRVHLHSDPAPGSTFYRVHVDVFADDEDDAIGRALDKLRRGAFPDRGRGSWVIDRVEQWEAQP